MSDSASTPAGQVSRRPYLLRAMHEWMLDCGYTPHLIVDTECKGVQVPVAYVKDNRIVLNVSMTATQQLALTNQEISFDARFGGVVHHVAVPVNAVLGIYARETGEGMVFDEVEPEGSPPTTEPPATDPAAPAEKPDASPKTRRPRLTVVK